MSTPYVIQFRMPHGVALRQDATGLIRVTYDLNKIPEMRETFEKIRYDLLENAIRVAKKTKEDEMQRQKLPVDRMTALDNEIKALEDQRVGV